MLKKFIYSLTFILVLSWVLTSLTEAAEPVGWWKLDDGVGLTAEDSAGDHDGTLTDPLTWVEGIFGSALEFEGGNGSPFVDLGAWQTDGPEGLSVCWWAKWAGTNGSYQGFLSQREGTMNWWTELNPSADQLRFKSNTDPQSNLYLTGEHLIEDEWVHLAFSHDAADNTGTIYLNGEERLSGNWDLPAGDFSNLRTGIGVVNTADGLGTFNGALDEVMIFQVPLSHDEVLTVMKGEGFPEARSPTPPDGSLYEDTWVTLSWNAGDFAVSHNVYMGDNFDDVNNGTGDTFRGNQELNTMFYIAGFPPYAYPDGLVNGTTYYWRIDEINDADPNSPWKGPVWSFMVPPKTAYHPEPADSAEFINVNAKLSWTAGFGSKLHYIVFGEDFDEVSNTPTGIPNGTADYDPGELKLAKTYFWRVDEFDGVETHKGEVWSFTTLGAVSSPYPVDGAVDIKPSVVLSWQAGAVAASHEIYFGTDMEAVKNAVKTSPEYKGPKALGEESYETGNLKLNTTYYWRVDEVNDTNPDSPFTGNVWSFTTGDYFVIDDFESYDSGENQIWYAWHDGLGAGAPGTPEFLDGNGTGSAVGDETNPSYTEETIVHGGNQSMPVTYDNDKQGYAYYSQVELTLTDQQDWTEQDVAELSIWFR
ncbi:MAG: LamG domain-containing protein, partial [Planctomycetota bacterium]